MAADFHDECEGEGFVVGEAVAVGVGVGAVLVDAAECAVEGGEVGGCEGAEGVGYGVGVVKDVVDGAEDAPGGDALAGWVDGDGG